MGGSLAHFQRIAYVACLISFSTEAFLVYNLAYLNLQPKYKCVNSAKPEAFVCKREATCSANFNRLYDPTEAGMGSSPVPPPGGSGYFFVDRAVNSTVLVNWVQDLNMRCADSWQVGMFGSLFFVGHVMGSTLLSEYGDTIGRIPMIRFG